MSNIDGIYTVNNAYDFEKNIPFLGITTTIRRVEFSFVGVGTTNFSTTLISFDSNTSTWDSDPNIVSR